MTTGASAEPRAGCPSCLWEGPGPSAFCSDESAFFATCRSAEDDEEPPLPAPQPTEKLAASAARMRKANAPCATLRKSVLVPISSLPPTSLPYRQLYSLFSARPKSRKLTADSSNSYAARAPTDQPAEISLRGPRTFP